MGTAGDMGGREGGDAGVLPGEGGDRELGQCRYREGEWGATKRGRKLLDTGSIFKTFSICFRYKKELLGKKSICSFR